MPHIVVDVLVGDGMITKENENFSDLIDDLLFMYDRHESFMILRATSHLDKESTDIKQKVYETIRARRKNAR
tara:strand:- start:259 stop:474 length:216 start_codon:yes stop_codon:yes gene_type:complete